jgi:peptidoglycan-N-acetylglucosamine deacetylase
MRSHVIVCRIGRRGRRLALALSLISWLPGVAASGSGPVLASCWSPSQLAAASGAKAIREFDDSALYNRTPPVRPVPILRAGPVDPRCGNSIRRVSLPPGDQRIALTFDLCEVASDVTGYDAGIVNYLRSYKGGIPATFYAGGKWMRSHPEQTKQLMADPLFELGNHGWTHGNLGYLGAEEAAQQIDWTQAQYELLREELAASACVRRLPVAELERIPRRLGSFRFPFGNCNDAALRLLAERGLPAVQWDVVTGDPTRKTSAAQIAATVLRNVRPGSIIIAHANGRGWHTAEALPLFVPQLVERGFRFVTVSELLAAGEPVTTPQCFSLQPGDLRQINERYGKGTEKPWPR